MVYKLGGSIIEERTATRRWLWKLIDNIFGKSNPGVGREGQLLFNNRPLGKEVQANWVNTKAVVHRIGVAGPDIQRDQ